MISFRRDAEETLLHEEFIRGVQRRSGLHTPGAAVLAVEATLAALGERLRAEALNERADEPYFSDTPPNSELELVSLLPERMRTALSTSLSNDAVGYEPSVMEFPLMGLFERVSMATGVGLAEAERHARAVALTLREAVEGGGLDGLLSRLPDEYEFLFV